MPEKPPGTLRDRSEAATILFAQSMQWLVRTPDANMRDFIAWLESREWVDTHEDPRWLAVLQYDAELIGRPIWGIFQGLQG